MRRFIQRTLNPAWYQGDHRKPPYFEGWYFKVVTPDEQQRYAFIPGVFLSNAPHAFVQVLDGATGQAWYHEYPLDSFWAAKDRFEVHVGPNRFTSAVIGDTTMNLLIDRPDQQIRGELRFGGLTPWPVTLAAPGIMGWYAWVPLMECYHGVVSLDHTIYGALEIDGRTHDFTNGRGYIEKDWGRSFPQAWIWMQTNHFDAPATSLTGSIAIIPWVRQAFPGFIVGFWHGGKLHRFATYTGARTEQLAVTDEHVHWVLRNRTHRLQLFAERGESNAFGLLKGPNTVEMGKRVAESLTAVVNVELSETNGARRVLFAGNGRNAGLEVHDVQALLALQGGEERGARGE